jgi:hypothetical protein
MTLILQGTDNSVSSPAVQGGTAGTTTGIYYPSTNTVAIATNGAQALNIDSNGYLNFVQTNSKIFGGGSTAGRMVLSNNDGTTYLIAYGSAYGGSQSSTLSFVTNTNYVTTMNSNGNLVLNGGTLTASGVGITFPATQSASSDANCLDDYEEGTFTPTVLIGGTSNSIATATGTYTKIGNVVFFACRAENVTKAGTGSLTMGNFPFVASSSGNQNRYSQFTVRWTGINSGGVIIGLASTGNAAAEFQNFTTTGGYSGSVSDGSISASYSIYGVSGFYYTA